MLRGIRGAITVEDNQKEEILAATKELLSEIVVANDLELKQIASIFFSMTADLDQVFPAAAARELGWTNLPLFCTKELEIEGSLDKCIRVLIHYNTDQSLEEIKHIYLKNAQKLRPDLVEKGENS